MAGRELANIESCGIVVLNVVTDIFDEDYFSPLSWRPLRSRS